LSTGPSTADPWLRLSILLKEDKVQNS